jgi:hypothetical protein
VPPSEALAVTVLSIIPEANLLLLLPLLFCLSFLR